MQASKQKYVFLLQILLHTHITAITFRQITLVYWSSF